MQQKWPLDFSGFCLVPFEPKNYEPFAPKPENEEKRKPFGTNVQKCAPFRIVGKAVPKSANPLQPFSKSPNPLKVLSRICTKVQTLPFYLRARGQKCEPFAKLRQNREPLNNPFRII